MVPILSRHPRRAHGVEHPSESREINEDPVSPFPKDNVNLPHKMKLTKFVTLPARSQAAVPVQTEASGPVFIEPKYSVLARHNVRTANRFAELKGNRRFNTVVSNFSE